MASTRKKYAYPFNEYPYNVPVSFYFKVTVVGFDEEDEGSFQDVSGINVSMEMQNVIEGGVNEYSHRLPIRAKYENLVLKRGLLHGSSLYTWVNNAVRLFAFSPKTVQVSLMNELGSELVTWSFSNAYPVGVKISEFKSTDNTIVIETLELAYNYFDRVDVAQTYT